MFFDFVVTEIVVLPTFTPFTTICVVPVLAFLVGFLIILTVAILGLLDFTVTSKSPFATFFVAVTLALIVVESPTLSVLLEETPDKLLTTFLAAASTVVDDETVIIDTIITNVRTIAKVLFNFTKHFSIFIPPHKLW